MTARERETMRTAYGSRRTSAQRLALAESATKMPGAFTVDELAARARQSDPGLGVATAYRAVAAMTDAGFLEQVGERDGRALYARCGAGEHHHHLVCTGCGSVSCTPCPFDETALNDATEAGFVVTSHEVTVYGLCASCAADTTADPRRA